MSASDCLEQIRQLPPEDFRLVQEELLEDWVDACLENRVLAWELEAVADHAIEDHRARRSILLEVFLKEESEPSASLVHG